MSSEHASKRPDSTKRSDKDALGLTVKKSGDFSEWYTQVVLKAELADYASGKGFIVLRPYGFEIWDQIKTYLTQR